MPESRAAEFRATNEADFMYAIAGLGRAMDVRRQRRLADAGNAIVTTADCTAHAELNLVRRLDGIPAEILAGATHYASAEPCAMCAGAVYWSGVGRLVFGLANARLYGEVLRASPEALRLSSRAVLAAGERKVAVTGPLLEDEAAAIVATWAATRRG